MDIREELVDVGIRVADFGKLGTYGMSSAGVILADQGDLLGDSGDSFRKGGEGIDMGKVDIDTGPVLGNGEEKAVVVPEFFA